MIKILDFKSLLIIAFCLVTVVSFQNCRQSKFEVKSYKSNSTASSSTAESTSTSSLDSSSLSSSSFLSLFSQELNYGGRFVGSASIASLASEKIMDDLFVGRAELKLVNGLPLSSAGAAWMVVHDNKWFLFDRRATTQLRTPSFCLWHEGAPYMFGTTVRVSSDKGQSWSHEVFVAIPSGVASDADACQILDGATFFDSETGVWHLWAQCLGSLGSVWKMCHYTSSNPTEVFKKDPGGVVENGAIWKDICPRENSGCSLNVGDEGTPEILYKKNDYFYVTFHGYNGVKGFRGSARTKDFSHFESVGDLLPGKALMTDRDCQAWNPGCIGPGKASSILTTQFMYMLVEAPTINLACAPGQNWPVGLVRAPLGGEQHGSWVPANNSPLLVSERNISCGISYANMFVDGDEVYVYYLRYFNEDRSRRDWNLYRVSLKESSSTTPPPPPVQPTPPPPLCTPNSPRSCSISNGTGSQMCNSSGSAWGVCSVVSCNSGYNLQSGACVAIQPPPPPVQPTPPPPEATTQYNIIVNPLLQYRIGDQFFNDNAWVGYNEELGKKYCIFRYGQNSNVDMSKSVPATATLNICNVNILRDSGTGALYCALGSSGSNSNGVVFSKITCATQILTR